MDTDSSKAGPTIYSTADPSLGAPSEGSVVKPEAADLKPAGDLAEQPKAEAPVALDDVKPDTAAVEPKLQAATGAAPSLSIRVSTALVLTSGRVCWCRDS